MKEVSELVRITNKIGEFKALVQAGGGNASIKANGEMVIKASGFTFSEMTEESGFSILDRNRINDFFRSHKDSGNATGNETMYNSALAGSMLNPTLPKPSMEAGMHIFLDRVVIHTHPVMANILNCAANGEKMAKELFSNMIPEILWVDYANPGYSLAKEIKYAVESYERRNGVKPQVIFLKNHGLIVSDNDSEMCVDLTISINKAIYEYLKTNFKINDFPEPELDFRDGLFVNDSELVREFYEHFPENKALLHKFLIPDDAVYCSQFSIVDTQDEIEGKMAFVNGKSVVFPWGERKSIKANEMLVAKIYMLMALKGIGDINFLKDEDVNYVLGMESEKYRQSLDSG